MATLIDKNAARRVQYKIEANKTEIMFPNLECLSAALLRDLLPSGSTPAGDSAYITDASDLVPVESLKVNIQPMQAGTGDPSPENVRPITGWDTVKVTRTGKNLLKFPYETNGSTSNGITFAVNPDGTITMNGTATATAYFRIADDRSGGNAIFKLPSGDYTLTDGLSAPNNAYNIYMTAVNGDVVVQSDIALSNSRQNFTIPDSLDYTHFRIGIVVQPGQTLNNLVFKPMIRFASETDPAFEPYQGETYDITFPTSAGTVYGGTLDVTTGELVVDKAMIESYNGETLPGEWISDRDVYASGTTPTTGAQVVYELATPQTYALTPQQVTLLKGINNVSADAGTVEVKYSADIQLYIDKKIAETQALILEN